MPLLGTSDTTTHLGSSMAISYHTILSSAWTSRTYITLSNSILFHPSQHHLSGTPSSTSWHNVIPQSWHWPKFWHQSETTLLLQRPLLIRLLLLSLTMTPITQGLMTPPTYSPQILMLQTPTPTVKEQKTWHLRMLYILSSLFCIKSLQLPGSHGGISPPPLEERVANFTGSSDWTPFHWSQNTGIHEISKAGKNHW